MIDRQPTSRGTRAIGDAALTVIVALALTATPSSLAAPPPDAGCLGECPTGAIDEGEACGFGTMGDDPLNCGCTCGGGAEVGPFTAIECGATYCGTGYFDGEYRDVDWLELLLDEPSVITVRAEAEFANQFFRITESGPDHPNCEIFAGFEVIESAPCVEAVFEHESTTESGFWYMIAADFSAIVDCNDTGARWVISVECVAVPPACPWDFDGDGAIGFSDLLQVLANWGPCPE